MQRSRIDEILLHKGLRWREHETWFGERVDPAFAKKGVDRNALHRTACGLSRGLPRRDETVIAKSYAGRALVQTTTRLAECAKQEIDYGR